MKKATQIYQSIILATALILSAGNVQAQCDQIVEPNNSFTQYHTLEHPRDYYNYFWSGINYAGDLDYYRINNIGAAGILTVILDKLPYDYDLRVYSAAGSQIAYSNNGGITADQININVFAGNSFYIRVEGYNGAFTDRACYRLATKLEIYNCVDNFENNNSLAAAKTIPINQYTYAKISNGTDQDWFKINTTASAPNVRVTLSNASFNVFGDYDLSLYNANGALLNTSSHLASDPSTEREQIVYNTPFTVASTYYIKVTSRAQTNGGCYRFIPSTGASPFSGGRSDEDELVETVDNNVVTAMSVYPNPAIAGQLLTINLNMNTTLEKISIMNTNGETVSEQKITMENGKATINLEGIAPGIYILDAGNAGKQKLVVQ